MSSVRMYLVAARISTSRAGLLADPLEIGADSLEVEVRDGLDHPQSIQTRPAWRPVRSPSRRWE